MHTWHSHTQSLLQLSSLYGVPLTHNEQRAKATAKQLSKHVSKTCRHNISLKEGPVMFLGTILKLQSEQISCTKMSTADKSCVYTEL